MILVAVLTAIAGQGRVLGATQTITKGTISRPLVYEEFDGNGGTTFSPRYLLGIAPNGITSISRTDSQGQPTPDFTITTGLGDEQVTTPYYIYKAGNDMTLPTADYGQDGVEFTKSDVLQMINGVTPPSSGASPPSPSTWAAKSSTVGNAQRTMMVV